MTPFLVHQERRGCLAGTLKTQRIKLTAFARYLEPLTLLDASRDHVEAFLDSRRLSARTRYDWLSLLGSFYRWAMAEGLVDRDPTAAIPRPRVRPGLPRPISEGDLMVAVECAPQPERCWLVLGAYAGLRCAEIATLEAEDVLVSYGLLRVVGKGRRERLVPMHPRVMTELRAVGVPRAGVVFRRSDGGSFTPAQVSRRLSRYLTAVGIDATAHQLRHRFATQTYAAVSDLRVVQELLGHSSPTTTAIYTGFSSTVARDAVARLP